jgi:hypothetical protein
MTRLEITDNTIRTILLEVAPLVARATGWELDLTSLHSRVLPRNRGYEEMLLGRLQGVEVEEWKELMPDLLERMLEYVVEQNSLAAYMPGSAEILVIRENVDDSNLDGLKLVLAHELVHRAQHITHPQLFRRVDALMLQALRLFQAEDTDMQRMQSILEQVQPVMTLLESHAAYVQGTLKQAYFPEAHIETHFSLAALLMRIVAAPKLAQYTDGLPQVAEAVRAGRLDALFDRV